MQFTGNGIGGQYKTDDNVILEIDAEGRRKVQFHPHQRWKHQKQWNS